MSCVPSRWFAPLIACCLTFATSTAPLPAQGDRVRQALERAAADLGDAQRAPDAMRQLENLGAAAVPVLCDLVRQKRLGDGAYSARLRAVYVLGRMGRAAMPAVPALRETLRGDDHDLARDAAWALGVLLPFGDEELDQAVLADLEQTHQSVRNSNNGWVLLAMCKLGPKPSCELLTNSLASQPIAPCRWIVARSDTLGDNHDDVLAAVVAQLDAALERPEIANWRARSGNGPDAALAWLALTKAPLSVRAARALLDHWHADDRERAIACLEENGASLPLRERADLVGRLWDLEPRLVGATARALGRWGRAAFVALPALRLVASTHDDEAVRTACRDAAAAIVAACNDLPANDRAWVAAADSILQGNAAAAPAKPCSRAGLDLLGESLYLAQWNDPVSLGRLLNLVESAGPIGPGAIQAVLGWLNHDRAPAVEHACAWLARRGMLTEKAYAATSLGGRVGFASYLRSVCQYTIVETARRTAVETLAHLLASGAWDSEHELLLEDTNSRVVAHALAVALAERKGALQASDARLRALVYPPESKVMIVVPAAWANRTLPVDLGNHVRTLAAIALAEQGADYTVPPDLDDVVRQIIGVPLADLGRHVADLRESNRLRSLLDRIEDQCRLLMSVPPHLRWPSLAGTTR